MDVNQTFEPDVFRAHPIFMLESLCAETGMVQVSSWGTPAVCPSSASALVSAALFNRGFRSGSRLCRPQSKWRCIDECLKKVCVHPSSGHIKILSASSTFVGLGSSWLSSSSVSVGEVGLRLCLIAAK